MLLKVVGNSGIFYLFRPASMTDAEYDRIKPIIEAVGGHWSEKLHGFVFREDVTERLLYAIENGVEVSDTYKYQEKTQFYPTPVGVSKRVVELANIKDGMRVLEPSAGTGRLVDQITVDCSIVCVECLPENARVLREKGYDVREMFFEDFAEGDCGLFDVIIMNPPFSQQRDAIHTMMAYDLLKEGGTLVSIISENCMYYDTEISETFRLFLGEVGATEYEVPFSAFEESGTMIDTRIIVITKK